MTERRGVTHLRVRGKGNKTRYLPLHPGSSELISMYLDEIGGRKPSSPLFQSVKNNMNSKADQPNDD